MTRREVLQLGAGGVVAAGFAGYLWAARRSFLNDVASGQTAHLRPPGALPEAEFITRCIRCNQCAEVCENDCIQFVSGSAADGTPMILPREKGCILCMSCNNVCPTGALRPIAPDCEDVRTHVRMGTAVVDENICSSYNNAICGACIRACPFREIALKTGMRERPIVDERECVGCGLCENSCIVYPQAIRVVPASAAGDAGDRA